ncbi:MAG: Rpn family recombination-promoting nuclease/putative transposase [Phascolarctobacterium sp.]
MTETETTKFEDLTIQSNFMFKHVMGNKDLCQRFISNVMKCDVVDLEYIDTEKELEPYFDSKCVRLDVIVVDKNNNRYNLEMQVRNVIGKETKLSLLPKRARYYQSVMDMDMLQKGQTYDKLSPLVLVFVCAFDLFNEGRYVYTFKSRCLENLQLELANDVTTIFLNANGVAGDVTPQMVNFLEYVKTQVPNDAYTRELEAEVVRLKLDKEVRRKYMVLQAELRDTEIIAFEAGEAKGLAKGLAAGEAQGEAKKSRETAIEMLKDGEPLTKIIKYSKLSEENIVSLAKENGLEVVEA